MKDAVLPLARPIRTVHGDTLSSLVVPRGTNIVVGIMASNRQRSVWGANADVWRPERWLTPHTVPRPQAPGDAEAVPGMYSNMYVLLCACLEDGGGGGLLGTGCDPWL